MDKQTNKQTSAELAAVHDKGRDASSGVLEVLLGEMLGRLTVRYVDKEVIAASRDKAADEIRMRRKHEEVVRANAQEREARQQEYEAMRAHLEGAIANRTQHTDALEAEICNNLKKHVEDLQKTQEKFAAEQTCANEQHIKDGHKLKDQHTREIADLRNQLAAKETSVNTTLQQARSQHQATMASRTSTLASLNSTMTQLRAKLSTMSV